MPKIYFGGGHSSYTVMQLRVTDTKLFSMRNPCLKLSSPPSRTYPEPDVYLTQNQNCWYKYPYASIMQHMKWLLTLLFCNRLDFSTLYIHGLWTLHYLWLKWEDDFIWPGESVRVRWWTENTSENTIFRLWWGRHETYGGTNFHRMMSSFLSTICG